ERRTRSASGSLLLQLLQLFLGFLGCLGLGVLVHDLLVLFLGLVEFTVVDELLGIFQLTGGLLLKLVVAGFVGFLGGIFGIRFFRRVFGVGLRGRVLVHRLGWLLSRRIAALLALDDQQPAVVAALVCLVFLGNDDVAQVAFLEHAVEHIGDRL